MTVDTLWHNARLATLTGPGLGSIERGAVAAKGGKIVYAGPEADAPQAARRVDCDGRWITPGLIDCHTHLVYGGDRAREFEMRLNGATYEEIAKAGGGIVSTVKATRGASQDELIASALPRLDALIADGACTVEIKSGYGLSLADEVKMLRAARALAEKRKVRIVTTFLGAHALPPEANGDKDKYIDLVCNTMMPAVAREKLADAVDAFCEGIAFSAEQTRRVFEAAKTHGFRIKLHADQLSNLHGAELAATFGALSADHLEHTDEAGIAAMAKAGTVAVLLPGAFY
ncbi:MAG TPA: imidazolonepropionase, partial [Rhizomicrobium sp.]